jgi:hypothetical protein
MATDNTPPRLRLIVTIAVIVIITLIGLDFVFKSYFGYMTSEAQREKMAPRADYIAQMAAEKGAFEGAKMPIDKAMAELKGPRSEFIEPKASEDLGAMTGWSKLPKQAPLPAPSAPEPAPVPADADMTLDGGVSEAGTRADGGPSNSPDAGVVAPKPIAPHPPGH